jgi:hypothetical protein
MEKMRALQEKFHHFNGALPSQGTLEGTTGVKSDGRGTVLGNLEYW